MKIRQSDFDRPDPNNPDYSMHEVDFYGAIAGKGHRLSLRKNLKSGRFEVYKAHYDLMGRHGGSGREPRIEVIYTYPDLRDAVRTADQVTEQMTGHNPQDEAE